MRVKAGKTDHDGARSGDLMMWAKEGGVLYAVLRSRSEVVAARIIAGAAPLDDEIELEHQRSSSHKALARALGHDL